MTKMPSNNEFGLLSALQMPNDYGLYDGKMGLCIAHFLYGTHANDAKATEKALALLDEVAENIAEVDGYGFHNGLLGIGWAIEFLAQNNFIELNTDDFLADLDDEVYKLIMYSRAPSIHLNTGTLGRILYLYRRLTNKNPDTNFYKEVCNKECMVLLIDELYERLISAEDAILQRDFNELEEELITAVSQSLIMACKLIPLQLDFDFLNEIICKVVSKTEDHFAEVSFENWTHQSKFLVLLNAWYEAGVLLNINVWKEQALLKLSQINLVNGSDEKVYILHKFNKNECAFQQPSLIKTLQHLSPGMEQHNWSEGWLLK